MACELTITGIIFHTKFTSNIWKVANVVSLSPSFLSFRSFLCSRQIRLYCIFISHPLKGFSAKFYIIDLNFYTP
jgi:hypothetical protein